MSTRREQLTDYETQPVEKAAEEVVIGELYYRHDGKHWSIVDMRSNDLWTVLKLHTQENKQIVKRFWSDDLVQVIMPVDRGHNGGRKRKDKAS